MKNIKLQGVILTQEPDSNGEIMNFEGMTLPENRELPVTLEFGTQPVGIAKVYMENGNLVASVKIEKGIKKHLKTLYPAIYGRVYKRNGNIVEKFTVDSLALCVSENVDKTIKPLKEKK